MTLKVTKGHRNYCFLMGHISLQLVVCSYMYVTACDSENSFIFQKAVKIRSHVSFVIPV